MSVITIKPGMIFVNTWGYDMTLNDFIQVLSVSPSGKTAMVRNIESKRMPDSQSPGMGGELPLPGVWSPDSKPRRVNVEMTKYVSDRLEARWVTLAPLLRGKSKDRYSDIASFRLWDGTILSFNTYD